MNSKQATRFRIWATQVLREFIIKGFVLDDERLKQGKKFFNTDYFKEFNKHQQLESDFDREVKKIIAENNSN